MRLIASQPAYFRMNNRSGCVALGVLVAVLSAQERPSGPLVDFTVVSPTGTPVMDLTASEVEIRVDGRPRRIRQLRTISAAPAAQNAPAVPPPYGISGGRNTR